jgi:hypothetical protein
MGGRSILVVSEQLRHHSRICTCNLVRMTPRKRQQVLDSWYSDDGGSAAHPGDDRAPGPAAVPAVSLASGSTSVRNPVASTVCHAAIKAKETALMKPRERKICIHGSAKQSVPGGGRGSSNKSNPAMAGNGKAPVWYHKHWRPVNHTSHPIQMYESA